jgi:hypothetical protein
LVPADTGAFAPVSSRSALHDEPRVRSIKVCHHRAVPSPAARLAYRLSAAQGLRFRSAQPNARWGPDTGGAWRDLEARDLGTRDLGTRDLGARDLGAGHRFSRSSCRRAPYFWKAAAQIAQPRASAKPSIPQGVVDIGFSNSTERRADTCRGPAPAIGPTAKGGLHFSGFRGNLIWIAPVGRKQSTLTNVAL